MFRIRPWPRWAKAWLGNESCGGRGPQDGVSAHPAFGSGLDGGSRAWRAPFHRQKEAGRFRPPPRRERWPCWPWCAAAGGAGSSRMGRKWQVSSSARLERQLGPEARQSVRAWPRWAGAWLGNESCSGRGLQTNGLAHPAFGSGLDGGSRAWRAPFHRQKEAGWFRPPPRRERWPCWPWRAAAGGAGSSGVAFRAALGCRAWSAAGGLRRQARALAAPPDGASGWGARVATARAVLLDPLPLHPWRLCVRQKRKQAGFVDRQKNESVGPDGDCATVGSVVACQGGPGPASARWLRVVRIGRASCWPHRGDLEGLGDASRSGADAGPAGHCSLFTPGMLTSAFMGRASARGSSPRIRIWRRLGPRTEVGTRRPPLTPVVGRRVVGGSALKAKRRSRSGKVKWFWVSKSAG